MADYHPLVARAVEGLEDNTGEARRSLYERARAALVAQLRGVTPALSESDITRERLALEEAIRKIEAEQARKARLERAAEAPREPPAPKAPEPVATEEPAPPESPEPSEEPEAFAPPPAPPEPPRTERPAPDSSYDDLNRPLAPPPSRLTNPDTARAEEALRALRDRLAAGTGTDMPRWPRMPSREPPRDLTREPSEPPLPPPPSPPPPPDVDQTAPPAEFVEPDAEAAVAEEALPSAAPRGRSSGWVLKAIIALVVIAVLGALGAVGYRQRDRIVELYQALRGTPTQTAREPARTRPKIEDRIGSNGPERAPSPSSRQSAPATQPPPAVAQRVILYEEDPNDPNGKRFVGSVIWRTETVSPGAGLAPELAVKANIEVPERHFAMTFGMVRNTDPALPASHTIDIRFNLPPDFAGGGVANVPGILMKQTEQTRGVPLAGLAVKVTNNVFLIGLSSVDTDVQRNTQLLKERTWFDIPIVYNNGSRAILAMEKGTPGERAFDDAFTAWGKAGTAAR
jgi:hypothetical protein